MGEWGLREGAGPVRLPRTCWQLKLKFYAKLSRERRGKPRGKQQQQ